LKVQNLIDAYLLILRNLESSSPDLSSLYYFCEQGEHQWKDISTAIGTALFQRKLIQDPTPRSWDEVAQKALGEGENRNTGGNSRSRPTRLTKLGWTPKIKISVIDSVESGMDTVLEELKAK
jgi:hypothetical protein